MDPASTPARQVTYFLPQGGRPWGRVPEVVVAGPPGDPRVALTLEAVEHWNGVFAAIGTPFRLGAATHVPEVIPRPTCSSGAPRCSARGRSRLPPMLCATCRVT